MVINYKHWFLHPALDASSECIQQNATWTVDWRGPTAAKGLQRLDSELDLILNPQSLNRFITTIKRVNKTEQRCLANLPQGNGSFKLNSLIAIR